MNRIIYISIFLICLLAGCGDKIDTSTFIDHEISSLGLTMKLPNDYLRIKQDLVDKNAITDKVNQSANTVLATQINTFINQSMPNWTQFIDTTSYQTMLAIYPMKYTPVDRAQAKGISRSLQTMIRNQNNASETKAELSELTTGKTEYLDYIKYKIKYKSTNAEYINYAFILTKNKSSFTYQIMSTSEIDTKELVSFIQ